MTGSFRPLMDASGLSDRRIGEAVGVSQQAAWKWRKGYVVPTAIYWRGLAEVLRVPYEQIEAAAVKDLRQVVAVRRRAAGRPPRAQA